MVLSKDSSFRIKRPSWISISRISYPGYSRHASVPANYLKLSPNILRNFINEKLRTLEKLYDHWDIWLNTTSGITRINVNS